MNEPISCFKAPDIQDSEACCPCRSWMTCERWRLIYHHPSGGGLAHLTAGEQSTGFLGERPRHLLKAAQASGRPGPLSSVFRHEREQGFPPKSGPRPSGWYNTNQHTACVDIMSVLTSDRPQKRCFAKHWPGNPAQPRGRGLGLAHRSLAHGSDLTAWRARLSTLRVGLVFGWEIGIFTRFFTALVSGGPVSCSCLACACLWLVTVAWWRERGQAKHAYEAVEQA